VSDAKKAITEKAEHAKAEVKAKYNEEKQAHDEAGKAALRKLEEHSKDKAARIERMKVKLSADELQNHLTLLADQMKAKQDFQQQKMKNKLDVVSTQAEIEEELPKKITGINSHFGSNHALAGTKSHPFQEAKLRRQGREYNKLRETVVTLTHKLANLQQKAADEAAAEKFAEKKAAMDAQEQRQADADQDALDLAKFPQDYRDKLKKVQDEMMGQKTQLWETERQAELKKEAEKAAAYVSEDQKRIAEIKEQLRNLMKVKYVQSAPLEMLEQLDPTSTAQGKYRSAEYGMIDSDAVEMISHEMDHVLAEHRQYAVEAMGKKLRQ